MVCGASHCVSLLGVKVDVITAKFPFIPSSSVRQTPLCLAIRYTPPHLGGGDRSRGSLYLIIRSIGALLFNLYLPLSFKSSGNIQ